MKKKIPAKRIVAAIFAVLVLVIAIFGFYSLSSPAIRTQTASAAVYKDTVSAKMVAVREEEYITSNHPGVPVAIVKDSERIAKGQNIAAYLETEAKADKYNELQKSISDLKRYEVLMSQQHLMSLDMPKINSESDKLFSSAVDAVSSTNVKDIDKIFEEFSNKETTKQILIDGNIDFAPQVEKIKSKIALLQSEVGKINYVSSNDTGYYVSSCDGYECILNVKNLEKLSCKDVERAFKAKPKAVPSNCIGKLIKGYNWYLVGKLKKADALKLKLGQNVSIKCENVASGYIQSTVEFKGNPEKDDVLVVLKSGIMNEDISRLRIEDVQIVLNETEGLRVGKEAVRVIDGVQGVYILSGNVAKFRKLDVIYTSEDYVISSYSISEEREGKEGLYLKLYDEVIVEGKDLKDGKIVKK